MKKLNTSRSWLKDMAMALSLVLFLPVTVISCSDSERAPASTFNPTTTPTSTQAITPTPTATPASAPSDPLLSQQWYLINTGQSAFSTGSAVSGKDINYQATVAQGYTGAGIHVLVSDDGMDTTHEDIYANFDSTRSRDYTAIPPYTGAGSHKVANDGHGTAVTGIIGAVGYNNIGVRGIAPKVTLSSANLISGGVTQNTAMMVDQANTTSDIVNQSWGSKQWSITTINTTYLSQLRSAVISGRSSKGTVFVQSAGNDFSIDVGGGVLRTGNSNFDGNKTTPYAIITTALDSADNSASYASPGSNIWISAYGGEFGTSSPAILTTDRSGCTLGFSKSSATTNFDKGLVASNSNCNYTNTMNGTSSAAPMITGVIALILEANPNLTWRDVKHILASTATQVNPLIGNISNLYASSPSGHLWEKGWITNAAGYKFHNWFGFGRVNADAAIALAKTYSINLGTLVSTADSTGNWLYDSGTISQSIPDNSASGTTSTIDVRHNYVIEDIQIRVTASHGNSGDIGIELTSPNGTKSFLKNVNDSLYGLTNLNNNIFLSNAFYGENSLGTWTIKIIDGATGSTGTFTNWKLNIIGHKQTIDTTTLPAAPTSLTHAANYESYTDSPTFSFTASSPSADVIRYEFSVGTTAGGTDILNWTMLGLTASGPSISGLTLFEGNAYFINVRAINNLENISSILSSSGWIASYPWHPISITNSPIARTSHTAVWTGTEIVVWGGYNVSALNSGAKFNPSTDAWTVITSNNAPAARYGHTAIWTGAEMIIWGGANGSAMNSGAKYNPSTNTWTTITMTNAPAARSNHTAIWTGTEMIVFGGINGGNLNTGAKYNPSTDIWTAITTAGAPTARYRQTAVWTGTEMIIWGGSDGTSYFNTGAKYNPSTNSWTAIATTGAPAARYLHTAIWTGTEMIIFGGDNGINPETIGGKYNPSTNTWNAVTTANSPISRTNHSAIWTGTEMIIWGGNDNSYFNTGAKYNPSTDTWVTMTTTNAPAGRRTHTAIWTGTKMIVWGGENGTNLNSGGQFMP